MTSGLFHFHHDLTSCPAWELEEAVEASDERFPLLPLRGKTDSPENRKMDEKRRKKYKSVKTKKELEGARVGPSSSQVQTEKIRREELK